MRINAVGGVRRDGKNHASGGRLATLVLAVIGITCQAVAGSFELISTPDPTLAPPAGGSSDSLAPIISPDGRYVAFASLANNLALNSNSAPIPALFPYKLNVYLRDRTNLTTKLVSVNLSGLAGGNGDSLPTGISSDGRYVLFESTATDLVPGDTNNASDVFVRDLAVGTTLLVSVSTNGSMGDGLSRSSVMTPDGRYVAFVSAADNLVPGDTNRIPDVFVRDLRTRVTVLASVGAKSTNPTTPTGSSEAPDITPDGTAVAFYSTATNLVPGVTSVGDIYVHDFIDEMTFWASGAGRPALQALGRSTNAAACYNHALSADGRFVAYEASPQTGTSAGMILRYDLWSGFTDVVHTNVPIFSMPSETIRSLDMTPDGRFIAFVANTNNPSNTSCILVWDGQTGAMTLASGDRTHSVPASSMCDLPSLDASGRFVLFVSSGVNLVSNSLAGDHHVYLRDLQAGTTTLVDVDTNGAGAPLSLPSAPQMSDDGRFVVFGCPDAALVANDRNHGYDLFVRDVMAGSTELISARDATLPSATPNGPSLLSAYSVSSDGRYVAFASDADDLVPGITNGYRNVFVRDLQLGTNIPVSVSTNGGFGDGRSFEPGISANGQYVVFTSSANNLVAGDANLAQDVFVRDLLAGTTALMSVAGAGAGLYASAYSPVISTDGRYVMFWLTRTLSSGENVFVRDLQRGTNYALTQTGSSSPVPLAAMAPDGGFVAFYGTIQAYSTAKLYVWRATSAALVYSNALSGITNLAISPGGNRIAYANGTTLSALDWVARTNWTIGSFAPRAHPGLRFSADGRFLVYSTPLSGTNQVYLYDLQYSTNFLVSHAYDSAAAGYGASDWPEISSDGRFVAFRSAAPNIVPGDTNGVPDVFLYDRQSNTTTLMSSSLFGPAAGDSRSLAPFFSGDAQTLFFESWASDLVAQDFNQSSDLFAVQLYLSGQLPLFSVTLIRGTGPGQGPWLMWPAVAGKTYLVQFKDTLGDAQWQTLAGSVTIVGSQAYLNDLSAGTGPRFYRVVGY